MLEAHMDFLECEGLSQRWLNTVESYLRDYLDAVGWNMAQRHTLQYLKRLQKQNSNSTYRKKLYQIRKLLTRHGADWAEQLKAPQERNNNDITIWRPHHIQEAYNTLSGQGTHRYTALLLLGATSGLRAEELYALRREDIDMEQRTIYVRKSKTGKARHAFFNQGAKRELERFFAEGSSYDDLFNVHTVRKIFKKLPALRVKHLRKFFSQEWDRHGGNYNIKQLIMGRSVNGNIDLKHYAAQGVDDLRKAYDEVGMCVYCREKGKKDG